MRTGLSRIAVGASLAFAAAGCSIQPGPQYLPPTADTIVWEARTDDGKRLREALLPDLTALVTEIESSEDFTRLELREGAIGAVLFEESGRKCGLEFSMITVESWGTADGEKAPDPVSRYLCALVEAIGRHATLTANEDLDCFVFDFRWPAGVGRPSGALQPVGKVMVLTGGLSVWTTRTLMGSASPGTGGVIYDGVTLEIPRIVVKKIAESEIGMEELGQYIRQAGSRRRL